MKKLIVIAGPTASGKTALALKLATHFQTAVLSGDSRQCYHEMSIGVAKPSPTQLQQVPHYFIGSHSIHDQVSAGIYEQYGLACLQELFKKKDVVICVGGTGLYLQALCEGLDPLPEVPVAVNQDVEEGFAQQGLIWLQEEIKYHDPLFAQQGEMTNPARLMRALAFVRAHGISILSMHTAKKRKRPFEIYPYALQIDRATLHAHIQQRTHSMMDMGLLDEVRTLLPHQSLRCLRSVGYSELFAHLDGQMSLDEAVEKIIQHTRQYAKRQITWFKHQGAYTWMTAEEIYNDVLLHL